MCRACYREVFCVLWLVLGITVTAQVPTEVNLGTIPDSRPVATSFSVQNPSRSQVVRLDFLSGSSALILKPDRLVLDPLESAVVQATYTPEGYTGKFSRLVLVKSSLAELDNRRIVFTAVLPATLAEVPSRPDCDECRKFEGPFSEETRLISYENSVVLIDLYLEPECRGCQRYFGRELPRAAQAASKLVRVARFDVREPKRLAQLENRLRWHGMRVEIMPVAFVGGKAYQGLPAIKTGVRDALKH